MSPPTTSGSARALARALRDYLGVRIAEKNTDRLSVTWSVVAARIRDSLIEPGAFRRVPRERLETLLPPVTDMAKRISDNARAHDRLLSQQYGATSSQKLLFLYTLPELVSFRGARVRLRHVVDIAIDSVMRALDDRGALMGSLTAAEFMFHAIRWPRAARAARQRFSEEHAGTQSFLRRFEGELEVLERMARDEPVTFGELRQAVRAAHEFSERTIPDLTIRTVRSEEAALASLGQPDVVVTLSGADIIPRIAELVVLPAAEWPPRLREVLLGRLGR